MWGTGVVEDVLSCHFLFVVLPAAGGEKETGSKEGEGEDEGRKGGRRDSKTVEEIGGAREERNDIEAVTAEDVWSTSQHCMTCNTYESGPGNRLSKHSFGYNNIPSTPSPSKTTPAL